jgi:hypothetical protein
VSIALTCNGPWEIDHVQPRRYGGHDDETNLVLACERCNQLKGAQSVDRFLERMRQVRQGRLQIVANVRGSYKRYSFRRVSDSVPDLNRLTPAERRAYESGAWLGEPEPAPRTDEGGTDAQITDRRADHRRRAGRARDRERRADR